MSSYVKKRQYNIKGRADKWVKDSLILRRLLPDDPGVAVKMRVRIMFAVYKLMTEAYSAGYESGHKEMRERKQQNEIKIENKSVEAPVV